MGHQRTAGALEIGHIREEVAKLREEGVVQQ